jgi:hypothetical protein
MILAIVHNVSVLTKTHVTLGLVVLAVFEFITAMHIFGRKGAKTHHDPYAAPRGDTSSVCWSAMLVVVCRAIELYGDGWRFDGHRSTTPPGSDGLPLAPVEIAFVTSLKFPTSAAAGHLIAWERSSRGHRRLVLAVDDGRTQRAGY